MYEQVGSVYGDDGGEELGIVMLYFFCIIHSGCAPIKPIFPMDNPD